MTTAYQFPSHLNRVRAWDRAEGRSVEVHRSAWEYVIPRGFDTVQVSTDAGTQHYYTPVSALDFRYFGEPPAATWAVRRQWARRLSYDRRGYWRWVHHLSDQMLEHRVADNQQEQDRRGLGDTHFLRVARSEQARRAAARRVNLPSPAVLASDQRELARQRAAALGREEYAAWVQADLDRCVVRSHEEMFGEPVPVDRTAGDGPNFSTV